MSESTAPRRKVLLADDSATIHRVVELTFAGEPVDVAWVSDGYAVPAAVERERPDVLLVDLALPGRDGYELCAWLNATPEYRHVPVVVMAGAFDVVDRPRLEQLGASAIVTKPVEPGALVALVEELGAAALAPNDEDGMVASAGPGSPGAVDAGGEAEIARPAARATDAAAAMSTPLPSDPEEAAPRVEWPAPPSESPVSPGESSSEEPERTAQPSAPHDSRDDGFAPHAEVVVPHTEVAPSAGEDVPREVGEPVTEVGATGGSGELNSQDPAGLEIGVGQTGSPMTASAMSDDSRAEVRASPSAELAGGEGSFLDQVGAALAAAGYAVPEQGPLRAVRETSEPTAPVWRPSSMADAFRAVLDAERHSAPLRIEVSPESWERLFTPAVLDELARRVAGRLADTDFHERVATRAADVAVRAVRDELAHGKSVAP